MSERPARIAIDHDGYHAEHLGRLPDGRQFFLTTPFGPAGPGRSGGEYVALYVFDAKGDLLEAKIDAFGSRAAMNEEAHRKKYQDRLAELGGVSFERIEVKSELLRQVRARQMGSGCGVA